MPEADHPEGATEAACWHFGNAVLDERTLELHVGGELRTLARKPLEVLMFLLRNPGEVVTREELFEAVWPGRIVSETSLTNAIARLRAALGDEDQQLIRPVYGYGYRFITEVRREGPLQSSAPPPSFDFQPGQPVPNRAEWLLEKPLGGGAAGEVWLAQHKATRERRVFKFARDGSRLTSLKREITLFRLMRDTLGVREDLVPIVDWNLDEAPYFIGQEWSAGGNLADWADARGGIAQVPLAQRIELVAQAAEALAAAHTAGVLHKDLKPANLLVHLGADGQPRVRLSDFGSAHLVDQDRLRSHQITQMGFTLTVAAASEGTPAYLAPEVLAGQPPTALSDVYALGVVLYQMVVGDLRRTLAPGWEKGVEDELLREDIALVAAGDPGQRLSDANQLAHRLRNLQGRRLAREAEQARLAQAAQAQRQFDRARARRGLLLALGVTLSLALLTTSLLLWNAWQARTEARAEAARANAIAAFVTEDLLSAANPEIVGRRDITVREVLDGARQRIPQRFADDARIAATLKAVVGNAYAALGDKASAEPLLLEAERTLAATAGPAAAETQGARMQLRNLYLFWTDLDAAEATLRRASEAETAAGNPNPEIGMEADNQRRLLDCWSRYPSIYVANCTAVADSGLEKARQRFGPNSRVTYSALLDAADSRLKLGQGVEAIPMFLAALDGYRRDFPGDLYWNLLSELLLYQAMVLGGQAAEATAGLERLDTRIHQIYGPEARLSYTVRRWRASALRETGQAAGSLELLDPLRKSWLGSRPGPVQDYAWIESERAASLNALDRVPEAIAALDAGLAALAETEPAGGYWTLRLRDQWADLQTALGNLTEAEAALRRNRDESRQRMNQGEWLRGWCAYRLGALLAASGRKPEARPEVEEGLRLLEASLGDKDARSRQARQALAALVSG